MKQEWQPIETAPKDGSRILGFDGIQSRIVFWKPLNEYLLSGWAFGFGCGYYFIDSLTLWTPLPEPK